MRVQMATNITGVRDDSEWPRIGGVIDLPDSEAEDLIRNGYARPVADDFVPAAVDAQADDDSTFSGPNEAATVDPDVPEGPKSKLRRGGH